MSSEKSGVTFLGIGNPLLDISAVVPQEVLTKYDVQVNNAILAEEKHLPLYQELVDEHEVQFIAGGATQNSVRVAQWMSGTPGLTGFMGAIGKDDAFGKQLKTCAVEDGVDVHYFEDEDTPTGTCAVLVLEGERSLVANLSAANKFPVEHMATAKATELLESAQFYYIAGFFLTVSVESIVLAGEKAVADGKVLAMNLSAPFVVQFFGDQLTAAVKYCDYVFGNESEAEALGEKNGWGKEDLPAIALKLAALPKASGTHPRVVVFTQGAQSTIVATNGSVVEFPVDPLPAEQLVDTNGAGDAFVGGFMSQLIKGEDIAKCVDAGHWASRVIIQRSGCTFPDVCEY